MRQKILKYELYVLFFLTLFSFISFYFISEMPDNYFSISSENNSINFFTYYLSSLVIYASYYTGPWIFFPFFVYSFAYAFYFLKRDKVSDVFFVPLITTLSLITSYFIIPHSLGRGTFYFINNVSSLLLYSGLFITSSLIIALYINRELKTSFLYGLKNLILTLMSFLKRPFINLDFIKNAGSKLKSLKDYLGSETKMRVENFLKSELREKVNRVEREEEIIEAAPSEEPFEIDEPEVESPINIVEEKAEDSYVEKKKRYRAKKKSVSENQYKDLVSIISHRSGGAKNKVPDSKYFQEITNLLEAKLAEFKIEGKIINVLKGPVVDTFELDLGTGVKVSKVTGAAEDLSLALYGAPIRIVYPMKGRTTIGIEVPRNPREIIYLDEVLGTNEYKKSKSVLPIAMGKDAFGEAFVVDLATMPHMLVAGATGAGKSVFINTLLVSLLAKKSPNQMKLILIDPKQLELALYSRLPHLVMPVITDAKRASISLMWACEEMERRYTILKELGVRNIAGFNEKIKRVSNQQLKRLDQYYVDLENGYELPYLVIVIDEFADLILTKAGKEIENNICRLAAKARAAGIHLVIATQRPSVDVITGLIKSNFPTRVSFRVTTNVDSRTILNATGAEKLLGKGDMLYKHGVETTRVHSSYVDEEEIEALTDKLSQVSVDFPDHIVDYLENGGEDKDAYSYGSHIQTTREPGDGDELYDDAVKIVMEMRGASASMLQRRLRIGYNRAANLIDELEDKGIVGPAQGSKPRKIIASP